LHQKLPPSRIEQQGEVLQDFLVKCGLLSIITTMDSVQSEIINVEVFLENCDLERTILI
jgi:hypothetical protein